LGLRLRDLRYSTIDADPAGFTFAILASFLLGTKRSTASCATLLFGNLGHLSIHAAPNGLRLAMRTRFFFGSVTWQTSLLRIRFRKLRDVSVDTDPAEFSAALATTALCLFPGIKTLEFARLRLGRAHLHNVAIDADPAERWRSSATTATALRLFLGIKVPELASLGVDCSHLHSVSLDADPADRWRRRSFTSVSCNALSRITFTAATLAVLCGGLDHLSSSRSANTTPTRLAMRRRFLRRRIANKISSLGIGRRYLDRPSVDAHPALRYAIGQCLLSSIVALSAAHARVVCRQALHDLSINAIPARLRFTTPPTRFFLGTVTLTTPGLAIGLGGLNEFSSFASLKAAPARLAFFLMRERFLL
jgi:hypothetical protein